MHGLGNDFIVFDAPPGGAPDAATLRRLADRHTGIGFDQAVSHRTSTRLGPRAIREASCLQPYDPPYGWGYDPLGEFDIVDYGDMAFDYAKVADFPDRLTAHIRGILAAGPGTVTLGGDH